ncbi:MAG TPA: hypothetical protein VD993_06375 [Chitinophagaceae bacterium]|nr:hypothetical protein [Chitinophagaceae bacterium]
MLDPNKNKTPGASRQEGTDRPQQNQEIERENENVAAAYKEASKDIEEDPDMGLSGPNDDLDESESARLGEKTDLV